MMPIWRRQVIKSADFRRNQACLYRVDERRAVHGGEEPRVGKPLMKVFMHPSGVPTWKAAKAHRDKAVKASERRRSL